ncbi:MAG: 5'/3'-nucleotidase SurE [Rhodobiaceae bacterium]|nr:5'/3'-nucleotidase SurE [Rhodobiaceae bacterium]MCC0016451.1 5'/3'-nucleotidase SurE [Rhodobiaceae bacterium]MCC0041549.1 5'/3'-nucleotidase SurE [Rhodobiaceae bacterium]MCC0052788.1 5'/3'-nucleotidase SurE [Rhodobiaceae bacterium]
MRILITNDDGIHAPGLKSLEKIARDISDDVWVVAPEFDQSGVSHSLSLNDPMRLREIGPRHFAVKGTPTDCVIMGVRHILDAKPDMVLSGVNRGQNLAEDVKYSGTIAGAFEGAILGVPAMALSQAYGFGGGRGVDYACAEAHGARVVRTCLDAGLPLDCVVNINFPDRAPDDVAGLQVVRQGRRDQNLLRIDARHDGRGNPYYWLAFERKRSTPAPQTDLHAIYNGYISVTPLKLDMTDEALLGSLAEKF